MQNILMLYILFYYKLHFQLHFILHLCLLVVLTSMRAPLVRMATIGHAALGSLAFSILIRRRRSLPAVHGDPGDVSSPSQSHRELPFQFLVDQFAVVATFLTPEHRHRHYQMARF